ncbi:hypothetical protein EDB92DRAFT_92942 [Lactarius akahatsu]|uniref:Uncharacterized protein n=1 Tax=Lactarius akahatsu TaxID=416441 RepID=A0AAD4QIE7_9AGAM|nr:hypothetical protein EDB92DRAFT_92942 [Lactarius akahatsu]
MNRLTPVLYIRSTLANSRANNKKSGSEVGDDIERRGSDETLEPPTLAVSQPTISNASPPEKNNNNKGASEPESTTASVAGDSDSYGPGAVRRENSLPSMLRGPSSPFRGELSGETPAWVDDDPFEDVVVESISVGSVPVHIPHLTDPIAPFTGFAMRAEVVKSTSKYTEFRKAQKKTFLDRVSKGAEESEGGLFFASRERGRNPQLYLDVSNDERCSDERPLQQPLVDYLKVDIPDISIALPGAESSP